MPALKYIGPHDAVELRDLGVTVARGESFDCPDELAGSGPFWRTSREDDVDEDGVMRRFVTRVEDDLLEVLEPGSGLLAQPDNWQVVKAVAKKAAARPLTDESTAEEGA